MDKPRTLIVIPTLGTRIEMLRECLTSISDQKSHATVVVVHPPENRANLESLIASHPDVIFESKNLKMIDSVNYAMKKYSNHEFANWIGDDDLLVNNSISRCEDILLKNPKVVGVFGGCTYVDENGCDLATYSPLNRSVNVIGFIPAAIKLEGGLFRLSSYLEVGGVDPKYVLAPDVYITIRLRDKGLWKKVSGLPVSKFRIHNDSITAKFQRDGIKEARKIQKMYGSTLDRLILALIGVIIQEVKMLFFLLIKKKHVLKT